MKLTALDLAEIKRAAAARLRPDFGHANIRITVGMGTCGISAGARAVFDALRAERARYQLDNVSVVPTGCIGVCRLEPIVEVFAPGAEKVTYVKVTPDKAAEIVVKHIVQGNPIADMMIHMLDGKIMNDYTVPAFGQGVKKTASCRLRALVCDKASYEMGRASGLSRVLKKELFRQGLADQVEILPTASLDLEHLEPMLLVYPGDIAYCRVQAGDIAGIVAEHFGQDRPVARLLIAGSMENRRLQSLDQLRFMAKQVRIALKNCGIIDPEQIVEYIAADGYAALAKALQDYEPGEVVGIVKQSGLRGRGGGGFPTGLKWEAAAAQPGPRKYMICNADEGDPGAFMDRAVLEGDPHAVLEAMAIGGYAIGADKGYIYVRAEYPVAVKRLGIAIRQAREYGLLGEHILGSGFSFDVEIRLGAGAFVCGEETALINSIEGRRGMPDPKPPFPAESGLWGKPTVINNVETLANIPQIVLHGAAWFAVTGTEKSKGTKVFALGGKIVNTGLVEVPMGISLREVIYDIGGGIPGGKRFKAVQTGGPSGGCLTEDHLDTRIDYDTLTALGSMMGSGGMIVMDEDNCMVDVARFYLDFTKDESCGKCAPCRIGTKRLLEILEKITEGKGTAADLVRLEELSRQVKAASLCGLGQTAPNPILSTLRYFSAEYEAHVERKKCPSGVCKQLLSYTIDPELCHGCGLCAKACPVNAISGELQHPYFIDANLCIRCGVCYETCKFAAISKG